MRGWRVTRRRGKLFVLLMATKKQTYWSLFHAVRNRLLDDLIATLPKDALREQFSGVPRKPAPLPQPSRYERYWTSWFYEFVEIHSAMEHLEQATAYLLRYPGSRKFRRLTEADWLRYHFEVYLQGTYVLRERLQHFLKKADKAAIAARSKAGVTVVRKLLVTLDESLGPLTRARGSHVHVRRYDDDDLNRLDGLVLFTKAAELRSLRPIRRLHYEKVLAGRRKFLSQNNKKAKALCAAVFELTTPLLESIEPRKPS
jgi:hypothetical protein